MIWFCFGVMTQFPGQNLSLTTRNLFDMTQIWVKITLTRNPGSLSLTQKSVSIWPGKCWLRFRVKFDTFWVNLTRIRVTLFDPGIRVNLTRKVLAPGWRRFRVKFDTFWVNLTQAWVRRIWFCLGGKYPIINDPESSRYDPDQGHNNLTQNPSHDFDAGEIWVWKWYGAYNLHRLEGANKLQQQQQQH